MTDGFTPGKPDEERVIRVPSGDPTWSIWIWRQDSMLLARLRPVLEQLVTIADEPCLHDAPHQATCVRCRLRDLLQPLTKGTP